jgi:bifunctional N-acetylglucosamine-1-phosphate-uridyltransferase/glucosamine-1-phosphate-acetyltransferase GlmU-like protein
MDDYLKKTRQIKGFLDANEAVAILGADNDILDPYSVLISKDVKVGKGNVFYPNVIIEAQGDGTIAIGDNNVFYPGTYLLSSAGSITVGNGNEFGANGCTIKANMQDAQIIVGDGGRYCDGTSIMGKTSLGSGSQVLGSITVQGCTLAAGGTFQTPDPDERAAVLKGFGLARGIALEKGQVVNGSGNFADRPIEWQRDYHPKAKV